MTPDEIRAFLLEHVEKFSQRDAAALAADHARDGVIESPRAGAHRGRTAIEAV